MTHKGNCKCGAGCPLDTAWLFFRDIGFYPIMTTACDDPADHAACNPGTQKIEDVSGKILWQETVQ